MTPSSNHPRLLGVLAAFAAVYVVWGSTYLAILVAIETLPPYVMAGFRFAVAGLVLYAIARARGAARPTGVQWRSAVLVGGLLVAGGNGSVCWSEQTVPSGIAALLVTMVPFWMLVVNWVRRGGVRPSTVEILGLVIGFGGVVLLVNPFDRAGSQSVHLVGAIVLVFASLAWAIGSIASRHMELPKSPLLATAMEMFGGGLVAILFGGLIGEWGAIDVSAISLRSVLALIYLIVFGSLIAFTAYIWLLGVSTPARVATYAYVNPVIAVFLGWAIADEPIGGRVLLAAAIIVVAVVLITTYRTAAEKEAKRSRKRFGESPVLESSVCVDRPKFCSATEGV